ncbi:SSU ribosomal protein S29e (S14p) [Halorubrum sp. DM2]|uniref:30S ribosomal protein S14 n=1 Tax=Halorubrum sp. DM2 TaxID=2527867 RepID=UPI0024B865B5|nr:30S ribosomal protein S14 [Halorubrum sp. DM2]VTT85145.1 SSU ribosomal protein S29e (S14p) [Halorubrum sp. DM2]
MTRDTSNEDSSIEQSTGASNDDRHVCRVTGREQGLVGKYDIWLCRQSFRELAPAIGFEKYD